MRIILSACRCAVVNAEVYLLDGSRHIVATHLSEVLGIGDSFRCGGNLAASAACRLESERGTDKG